MLQHTVDVFDKLQSSKCCAARLAPDALSTRTVQMRCPPQGQQAKTVQLLTMVGQKSAKACAMKL